MRRLIVRGALVAALLSTSAYAPRALGNSGAVPPADVMTRIRQFLGVQPRTVSVGGTRSRGQAFVCLLSPGPIQKVGDVSEIQLVQSRPNLVFGTTLSEVEIRSGKDVLWSQLATSKRPVQGNIPWPIEPIRSNQRLELAMRASGSAGGDWAIVTLKPPSSESQKEYSHAAQISVNHPGLRVKLIDAAISKDNLSLAQELLWSSNAASSNGESILAELQKEQRSTCAGKSLLLP